MQSPRGTPPDGPAETSGPGAAAAASEVTRVDDPAAAGAARASRRTGARVPRIGRVLDLVGLLLFSGGGGLYAWAWAGFRRVRAFQPSPDDPPWAAVRMADGYWRLQKVGVTLMLVGIAVFVLAWWVARRAGRRGEAASTSTEAAGPG